MKRFTLCFISCLVFSSSLAQVPDNKSYKDIPTKRCVLCIKTLKDGIYAGAGLGYDAYRIKQNLSVMDVTGVLDQSNSNLSAKGTVGNLFLGYGQYYDWFYIAGEIFGNYSDADTSFSQLSYQSDFDVRTSYGASILPGIRLSQAALVYGRIGYTRSYFSAKENMPGAFQLNTTDWGNGIHYGIGIEAALYRNWSLRGDYTYTYYGSFSSSIGTSFQPVNNQFMLSVLYHFDYPCP